MLNAQAYPTTVTNNKELQLNNYTALSQDSAWIKLKKKNTNVNILETFVWKSIWIE